MKIKKTLINNKTLLSDIFNIEKKNDEYVIQFKDNIKGLTLFDEGLRNTSYNKTSISEVNKQNGALYYRGESIKNIFNLPFTEIAFNLIFDKKKADEDYFLFNSNLYKHFKLYGELKIVLDNLPLELHPMDFLSIGVLSLSGFDKKYVENICDRNELSAFEKNRCFIW